MAEGYISTITVGPTCTASSPSMALMPRLIRCDTQ